MRVNSKLRIVILWILLITATYIIIGCSLNSHSSNIDEVFDMDWYINDKDLFASLYNQIHEGEDIEGLLLVEYKNLLKKREGVSLRAYKGKKGYKLFSPQLTDEINYLTLAINSRVYLLLDLKTNQEVKDIEEYYPKHLNYSFFEVENANILTDLEDFDLRLKEDFTAYNFEEIKGLIDGMPIPNYILKEKNFFFVNASIKDFGAIHANGQILIYNWDNNIDSVMKFIGHEIGHEVGYAIFGRDYYLNENHETKQTYADIYNKDLLPDYLLPWEERFVENFAEDFAYIYAGSPKWTRWQGDKTEEVKAFIEDEITLVNEEDHMIIRDTIEVKTSEGTSVFYGGFNSSNIVITKDEEIEITIKGLQGGTYTVYAYIKDNVKGNLGRIEVEGDSFVIPLENYSTEDVEYIDFEIEFKLYAFEALTRYHSSPFGRVRVIRLMDEVK